MRGLREFAEQQAEAVQEAQREQFATLTLNTAVELTAAALAQVQADGAADEQAIALRDAMRVLFPEAVALVSAARQGFMRERLGRRTRIARPWRSSTARSSACCRRCRSRSCAGSPRRYIAGRRRSRTRCAWSCELNAEGKMATIDVLGEEITTRRGARDRRRLPRGRSTRSSASGLDSNVSVKLTGLGLELDYDLCRENLEAVVRTRPSAGTSSASTWRTRPRPTTRSRSTGSCARRPRQRRRSSSRRRCGGRSTTSRALADLRPNVRLCKGIYIEPPAIAFRDFEAVRANFVQALEALLDGRLATSASRRTTSG